MNLREYIQDPKRQHTMAVRGRVERGIRSFFESQGFLEVRTPVLVDCPGMEPYINTFDLKEGYLQTSPEFAMKKLLVGGLERVFQMATVFRKEPNSPNHTAEFTMLEWYRTQATYEDTMADTEELLHTLGRETPVSHHLTLPFPRLKVEDLYKEFAGVDVLGEGAHQDLQALCLRESLSNNENLSFDDAYYLVWLNLIEPRLPARACFVKDYPLSQAALARVNPGGGRPYAERFELYCNGMELANAFGELTDVAEQRARFQKDEQLFRQNFDRSPGNYQSFLEALDQGLPPSSGVALGVDRLVMLLAQVDDIALTQWLPTQKI